MYNVKRAREDDDEDGVEMVTESACKVKLSDAEVKDLAIANAATAHANLAVPRLAHLAAFDALFHKPTSSQLTLPYACRFLLFFR